MSIMQRIRDWLDRRRERTADWLFPPEDMHDRAAWDRHWQDQVEHGLGPGLFDMFSFDRALVQAMHGYGMTRVLCAGNGISLEPKALARAGLDVTALDLSPLALRVAEAVALGEDALYQFINPGQERDGGRTAYVAGDLTDASVCPGPFDVIIERRTLQGFTDEERPRALAALVRRLATPGIFFSHCHDNRWKPESGPPRHVTGEWFKAEGWVICHGPPASPPVGQMAWLFSSTG